MRSFTLASVAAAALLLSFAPANAEPSVANVVDATGSEGTFMKIYVMGVLSALGWSNAILKGNNEAPLYCVPDSLALNEEQAIDIAKRYADRVLLRREDHFTHVLVLSLQEMFPCPGPQP